MLRPLLRNGFERDAPPHGVAQIELPFDAVRPGRRVRVFEVRHEDVRARVQRVDDHLAIDGAGDLDTPIAQVVRNRRDGPLALADLARLRQKVRQLARVEPRLARFPRRQQLQPARIEFFLQRGDEAERIIRQDLVPLRPNLGQNIDIRRYDCGVRHAVKQHEHATCQSQQP